MKAKNIVEQDNQAEQNLRVAVAAEARKSIRKPISILRWIEREDLGRREGERRFEEKWQWIGVRLSRKLRWAGVVQE